MHMQSNQAGVNYYSSEEEYTDEFTFDLRLDSFNIKEEPREQQQQRQSVEFNYSASKGLYMANGRLAVDLVAHRDWHARSSI